MNLAVAATVFGVIFLAELPDKSLFASLVLGTRYRAAYVWLGAAAAFALHVVIAVAAGGLLSLLPRRAVDAVVAALFLVGAVVVVTHREQAATEEAADAQLPRAPTLPRVAGLAFGVVFVGEWGDITQITTANLAARYADPVSVGIGALFGLWAVVGLGITAGARLVQHMSLAVVRRITAGVLLLLAVLAAADVVRG